MKLTITINIDGSNLSSYGEVGYLLRDTVAPNFIDRYINGEKPKIGQAALARSPHYGDVVWTVTNNPTVVLDRICPLCGGAITLTGGDATDSCCVVCGWGGSVLATVPSPWYTG